MEITFNSSTTFLLLLVSSSLLLSFTEAICVPRNYTITISPTALAPGPATLKPPREDPPPTTSSSSPSPSVIPNLPFQPPHPVLKQICYKTDYPQVCLASIAPFLRGNVDPVSVLKIEIQAIERVFQKGINLANSIYNFSSSTGKDNLDTCIENYQSGLEDIQTSLKAIAEHDMGTLKSMLSATITYATTCEDGFSSMNKDSPMQELDDQLTKLGSNSLAIANLLRWKNSCGDI